MAGKHGKVSKKGLYAGLGLGRFSGGYAGLKAGEKVFPGAEMMELYPHIDPGQLGPEEAAVYAAVVAGYIAGGLGAAKAFTRYQELKEDDIEYTRPFLAPIDRLRNAAEFLDGDEEPEEDVFEGLELILEDEE